MPATMRLAPAVRIGFAPSRPYSDPATKDMIANVAMSGRSAAPALSGLSSRIFWNALRAVRRHLDGDATVPAQLPLMVDQQHDLVAAVQDILDLESEIAPGRKPPSPVRTDAVVAAKDAAPAMRAIHAAFGLADA